MASHWGRIGWRSERVQWSIVMLSSNGTRTLDILMWHCPLYNLFYAIILIISRLDDKRRWSGSSLGTCWDLCFWWGVIWFLWMNPKVLNYRNWNESQLNLLRLNETWWQAPLMTFMTWKNNVKHSSPLICSD